MSEYDDLLARLENPDYNYGHGMFPSRKVVSDAIRRQAKRIAELTSIMRDYDIWESETGHESGVISKLRRQVEDQAKRIAELEAREAAYRVVVAKARSWHESSDKSLSKSGRVDTDYYWRRAEHREQLGMLKQVQSDEEYNLVWEAINASASAGED